MADSLDDFFAKKDKTKKKGKGRLVAADLLPSAGTGSVGATSAAEPEEIKKAVRKKKDRDPSGAPGSGAANSGQEDGDWKDYELEEEKDYSGLRIQHLQSKPESEDTEEDGREPEYNEDGDIVQRKDEVGPWNKSQGQQAGGGAAAGGGSAGSSEWQPPPAVSAHPSAAAAAMTATDVSDESRSSAATAQPAPGKYVPPSMRRAAALGSSAPPPAYGLGSYKSKKKMAPNLTSEEDFPTLGGFGAEKPLDADTTCFEKVKGGGKDRDGTGVAPRLELANKFDALSF